jgi:muramoyltetrapeptide carboxypeptidase
MRIIKPKRLQKGDTVGIVSPSGAIVEERKEQFELSVKRLEELGLKVKVGKHVFDRHHYSAGTREARIEDFNSMWKDPEIKMILMSRGGNTANNILDGLDYKIIKKNPKIFMGMSDGTTLLSAIYAKTGLVTYHGPDLLWGLGRPITKQFKENFVKTLFEGRVGPIFPKKKWENFRDSAEKFAGWRCVRGGNATGILVGGHISCLLDAVGAGFGPDFKDKILFLEGTDKVETLDHLFTVLKLNGVFKQIKGLILGWFDDCHMKNKALDLPVADMVLEVAKDYSFPILEIGELGHNVENYIFPIGCKATIDADKKYLSIDEKTVS